VCVCVCVCVCVYRVRGVIQGFKIAEPENGGGLPEKLHVL
jgi:hypothetical protein